jgi:predicted Zn finger-like uncharacterized protein
MIISCEKCGAKFRLDDDAVKPGGSRVRCSLCRHVFTVYPPRPAGASSPGGEAVDGKAHGVDGERVVAPAHGHAGAGDDFENFLSDFDDDFFEDEMAASRKRKRPGKVEQDAPNVFPVSKQEEKSPSFLWRIFRVFFLLIVLLCLIGAALYYWAPELVEDYIKEYIPAAGFNSAQKKPDAGASRLVLSDVSGSFVESGTAVNLFVIRGSVKNEFPGSRSFIQLQGNILDDRGMVVLRRMAYAGNPIPDEELKVMSTEDIAMAMNNRDGMDGINVDVPSGSSVPFAIIFEALPENVVEFTVEAVGSVPGTL